MHLPSYFHPYPPSRSANAPPKPAKHVHWKSDYHPSSINLRIVCGPTKDPSLTIVFGLRFREGKRPKVRFSVRRGHGKSVELGDVDGDEGGGRDGEEGRRGGKGQQARRRE